MENQITPQLVAEKVFELLDCSMGVCEVELVQSMQRCVARATIGSERSLSCSTELAGVGPTLRDAILDLYEVTRVWYDD